MHIMRAEKIILDGKILENYWLKSPFKRIIQVIHVKEEEAKESGTPTTTNKKLLVHMNGL